MSERKLFLVSGGSGGIGAAVCERLAAEGFIPVVGYHRDAAGAAAIAQSTGGKCLRLDLTSDESISAAVAELAAQGENLVGLVLAASPPPALAPFGKTAPEEMMLQWRVNVLGPQRLLADIVRQCFRKTRRGSVVAVLSKAMGENGGPAAPCMAAYVIAKHGLAGVLAAAAAEYPWLQVSSIKPGFTETNMLATFDERFLALQRGRQPFQTPAEVAAMIVWSAICTGSNQHSTI